MKRAYLDHAAATPLRPPVRRAMAEVWETLPGNPSSVHSWGAAARKALEGARARIAAGLGVEADEVHFVRGGTESDNLAVLGRLERVRREGRARPLLVRSAVEHSAVRDAVTAAVSCGAQEGTFSVGIDGSVDEPRLAELLERKPILVSLMWVNHETGIILPVARVAKLCREAGVPFHVDGIQALGRIPVDPGGLPIDLLSLSAHKLGGPRGTGVLVVRQRDLLAPRLFGGGQESGLRPGTEDVAGAVGMAVALEASLEALPDEARRLSRLRDRLAGTLRSSIPGLRIHGEEAARAPHILNLGVPGLPGDILPTALDLEGVGISAGSACSSGSTRVSPVLTALLGEEEAHHTAPLRLSLGWTSTEDEVERALEVIPGVVERVRATGVGSAVG